MNEREIIRNTPTSQLIHWWTGHEIIEGINTSSLHPVGLELSRRDPKGVQFLKDQARSKDKRICSGALSALAREWCYDLEVESLLIDAFYHELAFEPGDVIQGFVMNLFVRVEHYPLDRFIVEPLLEHEDKWTSASAMVYLSRKFKDEAVDILREGLNSVNPIKRGDACSEVGSRNIVELRDDIMSLLNDSEVYVVNMAQSACFLFEITN